MNWMSNKWFEYGWLYISVVQKKKFFEELTKIRHSCELWTLPKLRKILWMFWQKKSSINFKHTVTPFFIRFRSFNLVARIPNFCFKRPRSQIKTYWCCWDKRPSFHFFLIFRICWAKRELVSESGSITTFNVINAILCT